MPDRRIGESGAARWGLVAAAAAVVLVLLLLPLWVLLAGAFGAGLRAFAAALRDPDALAAIRLTLLVAAIAVPANTVFGLAAAWCLARFRFTGRRLLGLAVMLPISVSPVVAGLLFILLFGSEGWFGPLLRQAGIAIVFALPGLVLATCFVTLPYVAAQLIPAFEAQGAQEEEAALVLGASPWQMLRLVSLPKVRWALLYGVLLCTARAMGEFGAVSVVSGHITGLTNTVPLQIEALYQNYQLGAAFALAALLAGVAVVTIAVRALFEWRGERARRRGGLARLATP